MHYPLTERAPPTSFPNFPTDTGSHSTDTSDTTTETETTDSDTITDITDPPIPPTPPVTTTNTTTSTTTSETTSDTTTSTSTSTSTTRTTTTTQKNTDPTSDPPSNTSPSPITSPPLAFTPTATSLPELNTTSATSVTANFTTIVTSLNGQATTITSQLPTSLINLNPSHNSDPHRTTIIAGTTTALFFFILSVLAAIFVYRRHKLRKSLAQSEKRKEGRGLLDGEDFDDDDAHVPPTMRSRTSHGHSLGGSIPPALSLLKSRVSATGSIFREEIWPPPGFVDPISKRSSQVDLGKIVDDVMGPTHEREVSTTTTASGSSETNPFLDNSHHYQTSSSSLMDNDPFSSSDHSSFYSASYLPPGASPPVQPGLVTSSMVPTSRTTSSLAQSPSQVSMGYVPATASDITSTRSVSPQLLPPAHPLSSSTQPKKSSPLVRALSERDKVLWPGGPAPPEPSVGPLH